MKRTAMLKPYAPKEILTPSLYQKEEILTMTIWTDNPVRDAERYFADQEEELEALPECDMCGHPIQTTYLYEVFGQCICEDCMNGCRWDVTEYMEDGYGL